MDDDLRGLSLLFGVAPLGIAILTSLALIHIARGFPVQTVSRKWALAFAGIGSIYAVGCVLFAVYQIAATDWTGQNGLVILGAMIAGSTVIYLLIAAVPTWC